MILDRKRIPEKAARKKRSYPRCMPLGDVQLNWSSSKIVSPEHFTPGEWYTCTISPIYYPYDYKDMQVFTAKYMSEFDSILHTEIKLYPEYSSKSRWHLHGIIRSIYKHAFYLHDVPQLLQLGIIEIDTIDDMDVWMLYCTKNHPLNINNLPEEFHNMRHKIGVKDEL